MEDANLYLMLSSVIHLFWKELWKSKIFVNIQITFIKSNSKPKTVLSYLSSTATKKQKIDDREVNPTSPSSETGTKLVPLREQSLLNELAVVKPMLQKTSLGTIIDLCHELYPFTQAFPWVVALIESAMTIQFLQRRANARFQKWN